jgi:hypothetical protein
MDSVPQTPTYSPRDDDNVVETPPLCTMATHYNLRERYKRLKCQPETSPCPLPRLGGFEQEYLACLPLGQQPVIPYCQLEARALKYFQDEYFKSCKEPTPYSDIIGAVGFIRSLADVYQSDDQHMSSEQQTAICNTLRCAGGFVGSHKFLGVDADSCFHSYLDTLKMSSAEKNV